MRGFREIRNPEHRIESPMRAAKSKLTDICYKLNMKYNDIDLLPDYLAIDDDGKELWYYEVAGIYYAVIEVITDASGKRSFIPNGIENAF